jgi:hypothetical protein
VGFVVDKGVLGQVFSEYFSFPCQSLYQLLYNHPHLSSGACTIGQKWPQYLVDLVPPHYIDIVVVVVVVVVVAAAVMMVWCWW